MPNYEVTMINFFWLTNPSVFNFLYHSQGGCNYRNIQDSKMDELVDLAGITLDEDKRNAIIMDLQQHIHDEAIDVVLWRRNGINAASKKLGGLDKLVEPDNMCFSFKNVWLES